MSERLALLARRAPSLIAALALVGCSSGDGSRPEIEIAEGQPEKPLHAPANLDLNAAGYVACSAALLEGEVVDIDKPSKTSLSAEIAVSDWIKPSKGPDRYTVEVDKLDEGVYGTEDWIKGTHLNLVVDVDPSIVPYTLPEKHFADLKAAVPEAQSIECPYGPDEGSE